MKTSTRAQAIGLSILMIATASAFAAGPAEPSSIATLAEGASLTVRAGEVLHVPGGFVLDGTLRVEPNGQESAFHLFVDGDLAVNGRIDATRTTPWREGPAAPNDIQNDFATSR